MKITWGLLLIAVGLVGLTVMASRIVDVLREIRDELERLNGRQ